MNSRIILVKNIEIDKEYTNVLSYTEEQMLELCRSQKHLVAQADNYSFIRTTSTIMTGFSLNQCLQANYIAFQNPDYINKWFFAWIDDVIYKGNKNTEISFTVDAWSTWYDYWNKKTCFINRQHTNNDTIGLHTIPENLDVGEVIEEDYQESILMNISNNEYYFAIEGTYNPITTEDFIGVNKINGVLNGNWIFLFDVYEGNVGIPEINNFIEAVNKAGKIESIKNMYILPQWLCDDIGTQEYSSSGTLGQYKFKLLKSSDKAVELTESISYTKSFNDYKPKNNKCFVYPYNYLLVSNNAGNNNIYKYEDFKFIDNFVEPAFSFIGSVALGGSVRLIPRKYKNIDYNYDESLPLAKFPTCSWASDAFTNWLTSNGVNIGSKIVDTVGGIATGNAKSVAGNVASLIGDFYKANLLPSIEGGNNTGDVIFSDRRNIFSFHHMRVKTEYLKIIDDYFTRFGYAVKKLENPNLKGRKYWNYVEIGTSEEIGYGEVPSKYMDIINNACRTGVTIWHNHENVGNYSLNNTIV